MKRSREMNLHQDSLGQKRSITGASSQRLPLFVLVGTGPGRKLAPKQQALIQSGSVNDHIHVPLMTIAPNTLKVFFLSDKKGLCV